MTLPFVEEYLAALRATLDSLPLDAVSRLVEAVGEARARDAQVFVVGNGGSAATASHFAVDLGKGASGGPEGRFRVQSLTDNVPWITALANDLSYAEVFSEQLRNQARAGDLLIAFSGSGSSENVIRAVRAARAIGCRTIGLAGRGGGRLREEAEECIVVGADHMGLIEDAHFVIQHIVVYHYISRLARGAEPPPSPAGPAAG
jgi:D-sedoheptulose 7-phosphate isomerase